MNPEYGLKTSYDDFAIVDLDYGVSHLGVSITDEYLGVTLL